jgi:hypothetical protein
MTRPAYAEGAELEPDPAVMPDMVGIDHLEAPASFTPLPPTLAAKWWC